MELDVKGKITGAQLKAFVSRIKDDADVPYEETTVPLTVGEGTVTYRRYVLWDSDPYNERASVPNVQGLVGMT